MVGREEYDHLVKYSRKWTCWSSVPQSMVRQCVTETKVGTCCNMGNVGWVFNVRISWVVTEFLSRHCIIGSQTDFG